MGRTEEQVMLSIVGYAMIVLAIIFVFKALVKEVSR
jgi:hypothetical protein